MNIVIADDVSFFPDSLTLGLPSRGHTVVGVAATVAEARRLAHLERPDVMVLDIQFDRDADDDIAGLHLAAELRRTHPDIGLLMLTGHNDPAYLDQLKAIGGQAPRGLGYLSKEFAELDTVAEAITRVGNGGVFIDRLLVERLARRQQLRGVLTKTEFKVLEATATGLSNAGIADALGITVKTVECHLTSIMGKLGLPGLKDPGRGSVSTRVFIVLRYLDATHDVRLPDRYRLG